MRRKIDPFIDFLPKIDLHGEDRVSAIIRLEEFINDNIKLHNNKIVVIHGIGEGIIKKEVYNYLKTRKDIDSFKQDNFNSGITIIDIKNCKC